MPTPTARLAARIRRDFAAPGTADEVIRRLGALPDRAFGRQDPERVQAALVLAARGEWSRFADLLGLLAVDWRDVLVAGELAEADWPARLDDLLPGALPGP